MGKGATKRWSHLSRTRRPRSQARGEQVGSSEQRALGTYRSLEPGAREPVVCTGVGEPGGDKILWAFRLWWKA